MNETVRNRHRGLVLSPSRRTSVKMMESDLLFNRKARFSVPAWAPSLEGIPHERSQSEYLYLSAKRTESTFYFLKVGPVSILFVESSRADGKPYVAGTTVASSGNNSGVCFDKRHFREKNGASTIERRKKIRFFKLPPPLWKFDELFPVPAGRHRYHNSFFRHRGNSGHVNVIDAFHGGVLADWRSREKCTNNSADGNMGPLKKSTLYKTTATMERSCCWRVEKVCSHAKPSNT